MRFFPSVIALLAIVLSMPAAAQESSRQDFDDFCQAWEGRWVSQRTLAIDDPGFGEAGDTFTSYADCKIEHDGNAMICKLYAGKGTGTWIVGYDAGEKKIKGLWITSGSVFAPSVIYREADNWVQTSHATQPDGTKVESTATIVVSDAGTTHTWTNTPTADGEETAPNVIIWHSVNR